MQTARLEFHVLRSGDHGSCALVRDAATDDVVCIDCGISGSVFADACGKAGVNPFKVRAFLITHGHGNQVKGLKSVLGWLAKRGVAPDVYVEPGVQAATPSLQEAEVLAVLRDFRTKEPFEVGSILVRPFRTFHNNEDKGGCYNFRLEAGEGGDRVAIAVLSDAGVLSREAQSELVGANVLAVEANYASELLESAALTNKAARFAVDVRGNFSNAQAAAVVKTFAWEGLTDVVAMYLSRQYNTPDHAFSALRDALSECGSSALVHCSSPDDVLSVRPASATRFDDAAAPSDDGAGSSFDKLPSDELVSLEVAKEHGYLDVHALYQGWASAGLLPAGITHEDARAAFVQAGLVSGVDGLPHQAALDLGAVGVYTLEDEGSDVAPVCSTAFPPSCFGALMSLVISKGDHDACQDE